MFTIPTIRYPACLFLALIAGCAIDGADPNDPAGVLGERAAYAVINKTPGSTLAEPRLLAKRTGRLLYANLVAHSRLPAAPQLHGAPLALPDTTSLTQDPGDEDLSLPDATPGIFALAGSGHRVPEHVLLSWMEPATRDGVRRRLAPRAVEVRAAIPPDVLAIVSNQWRYRLEVAVLAAANKPTVAWRLVSLASNPPHEVRRGGPW